MTLEDKDKAVLEMFKHYSNVRFLMLPLFFTVMGAILVSYWTLSSSLSLDKSLQIWVALAGAVISLLFVIYEYHLREALINVSALLPESMKELRHTKQLGAVTSVTLLLYAGPIVFWLSRIWHDLGGNQLW